MLLLISVLMLLIPLVFQIVLGNKSSHNLISLNFGVVCFFSLFLQMVITVLSFFLAIKGIVGGGNKCATGAVGIFAISFFITMLMLFIMIVQFVKKKLRERAVKLDESKMNKEEI